MKGRKGKRIKGFFLGERERHAGGSHKTDIYVPLSSVVSFSIILHSLVLPLLTKIFEIIFLTWSRRPHVPYTPTFSLLFFLSRPPRPPHIRPSLIESLLLLKSIYIFFFSLQWLPKPLCSSLSPLSLRSHLMVLSGSCRLMGRRKYI